jgi:hypothetical protein
VTFTTEFTDTLWDHLNDVLGIVVETFGQAGIGLPEKQYVNFGQPVHDCEQVTVQFAQMFSGMPGLPSQEMQRCDGPRSAALVIEITRCIPTQNGRGQAPTEADLLSCAKTQAIDAWMLMEVATKINMYGYVGDVVPGQASGGFQSVQLSVTTPLGMG